MTGAAEIEHDAAHWSERAAALRSILSGPRLRETCLREVFASIDRFKRMKNGYSCRVVRSLEWEMQTRSPT